MERIQTLYRHFIQNGYISTDSRNIKSGCLFFALKGTTFDGNQYALDALKNGASLAIIDDEAIYDPDNKQLFFVDNVLLCLQQLANYHRKQTQVTIIGLTGSNGKTTTKELINNVLTQKYQVLSTQGNLNNHIGVPLTLLQIRENHTFAIVEMGANHQGEIEMLCSIAEPNYGLITNIGKAHIEGFGSLEGIIKGKTELYRHLNKTGGTIFYNADNPILAKETEALTTKKITYGTTSHAHIRGKLKPSQDQFLSFSVTLAGETININTHLLGNYNFENAMAACCIGEYFHVSPMDIKKGINNYAPDNNRSQYQKTPFNELFLDMYNANPTSMEAAIDHFIKDEANKKSIILGDMLELGVETEKEHQKIIEKITRLKFTNILLVGPVFFKLSGKYPEIKAFENTNELIHYISDHKIKHQQILIKGSRKCTLEKVVPYL